MRQRWVCFLCMIFTAHLLLTNGRAMAMGLDFGDDPTAFFSSAGQVVTESSGTAAITVRLSDTTTAEVTIPFSVSGTATGGGGDYTISASPLIIPAGELTAEIVVIVTSDGVSEADETVIVTLETPTNAVLAGGDIHTLTITEDDLPLVDPVDDAVLPVYRRIPFFTKMFPSPVDVAVDVHGRMYVADSYSGTVFRFSPGGFPLDNLGGLDTPLCVAVDGSDHVYVGSQGGGSVAVYDADFNFLFSLGSGDGEFGHPGDIAVDSSGVIYIVDTKNNVVSRWDGNGNSLGVLGGPGDGAGQFNRPLSVAIDEVNQEIIVLDRSNGARVQFFDMTGGYKAGWYKYSTGIGGLIRPQQIAIDNMHRLYITESAQNVVLVYDAAGAYLGAVYDGESPVRSPVGLAVSSTNKLYVASRASRKVEVYGLDEYTGMTVNPAALSFTATVGASGPSSQELTLRNIGRTQLTITTAEDIAWLSVAAVTDLLAAGSVGTAEVAVDPASLTPGTYSGTISVSAGPGTEESVPVTLTVLPAPPYVPAARLSVTPEIMSFTCEVGSVPDPQVITIVNTGDASLYWEVLPEKDWMTVSSTLGAVAAGEAAQNVILLPNTASLTAGTYSGYLEVYADGAHDTNAIIDITLTLTNPEPGPSPTPVPGTSWRGNSSRIWKVEAQINGTSLNAIWGSSEADIFAVGDSGTILHYNGNDWDEEILPTTLNINSVWGTAADSVYVVGESGLLLHYDGANWTDVVSLFSETLEGLWCGNESGCTAAGQDVTVLAGAAAGSPWEPVYSSEHFGSLRGIWGISDSDIFAVGDFGTLLHYDGSQWTSIDIGTNEILYGVWGSGADDVYVVGGNGTIIHYDGTIWTPMQSGTENTLAGVWGNGADEVYAVGEDGTILLKGGTAWSTLETGITEDFNDAWAAAVGEIYVVGSDGSILFGRRSFDWGLFFPAILSQDPQVRSGAQDGR